MDLKLAEKNVLVTGGTAGIGAAIVEAFAREGANVAFCSRSQAKVDAMGEKLAPYNVTARGAALDINHVEDFSSWVESLGELDVFVHNVSSFSNDWAVSCEADIKVTAKVMDVVIPVLKRSSTAAITYIGSKVATYGAPEWPVYSATKSALVHYMKSLSMALAKEGVRVNVVSPGDVFVAGGVWDGIKDNNPDFFAATVKASPLGRLGTAGEIADSVVFISSPLSSFTLGTHLLVDGGTCAHVQG